MILFLQVGLEILFITYLTLTAILEIFEKAHKSLLTCHFQSEILFLRFINEIAEVNYFLIHKFTINQVVLADFFFFLLHLEGIKYIT